MQGDDNSNKDHPNEDGEDDNIQEFFISDLGGIIFDVDQDEDDDESELNFEPDDTLDGFGGPSNDIALSDSPDPTEKAAAPKETPKNSSKKKNTKAKAKESSSAKSSGTGKPKKRRQRNSLKIEGGEKGLPPPSWHSEAADKPHRQAMILDM